MIAIDANALVVLMIGIVDANLIKTHRRTSIYDRQDFEELVASIGNLEQLSVLPNVWTEVDNLLNSFSGHHKEIYIAELSHTIKITTELYQPSEKAVESNAFYDLGLTDTLLLNHAQDCKFLITSDSQLADYAKAYGVEVYDMVQNRNSRL